jgi:redox-sensing transcriptional repressor
MDLAADVASRTFPAATVARFPLYLRALRAIPSGTTAVSSEQLAVLSGVNAATVRKDLSHLGSYGTRGVGYHPVTLADEMSKILGLTVQRSVVIVGMGHLGQALAGHRSFLALGFDLVALVDADPAKIGERLDDHEIISMDALPDAVDDPARTIGVIAVPADQAQQVADTLIGHGVTSLLNFAPVSICVPPAVRVRSVDLAVELQLLAFERTSAAEARAVEPGGAAEPRLSA